MTQKHTINNLITKIIKENRKIRLSRKKIKIPKCIYQGCGYIRIDTEYLDRFFNTKRYIGFSGIIWTDDYTNGKLKNHHYTYSEISGTLCPNHLQEYYKKYAD